MAWLAFVCLGEVHAWPTKRPGFAVEFLAIDEKTHFDGLLVLEPTPRILL